jgi:Tol biopolymer transport system component
MITDDDQVKIVDFGLAKLSGNTKLTKAGSTIGTAAYMSPEQMKGEKVDHRTDIWSLGVLIYEMLTGQLPFKGDYEQAITYAVLNEEPEPLTAVRTGIPMALEWVVNKAMAKEPTKRYQHVDEIPVDLETIETGPSTVSRISTKTVVRSEAPRTKRFSLKHVIIALFMGMVIASIFWRLSIQKPSTLSHESILRVEMTPSTHDISEFGHPVFSPDGNYVAYEGWDGKLRRLYLRDLARLEAKPIPETESPWCPFFSPDSRWLGFFADQRVKKVAVDGGAPISIAETGKFFDAGWACWTEHDSILVKSQSGYEMISTNTGQIRSILKEIDIQEPRWFDVLPGGKIALCTIWKGSLQTASVGWVDLMTGEMRILIDRGTSPRYSNSGHIIYANTDGALLAVPIDLKSLKVTGSAVVLEDHINVWDTGLADFSISQNGALAYIPPTLQQNSLVLVDRQGKEQIVLEEKSDYLRPRFSPDGKRVVVQIQEKGMSDIWVCELERKTLIRLTFQGNNHHPTWTPDGKRITFSSGGMDEDDIFGVPADGSGPPELLYQADGMQQVRTWSRNGKWLLYIEPHSETGGDIWALSVNGEKKPQPLLQTQFNERHPAFSPDGGWFAYDSDVSGRREVYVQPFPDPSLGKWPISTDGGRRPVWSPDGMELFYLSGEKMVSVPIQTEPELKVGAKKVLFEGAYRNWAARKYDIHPDGDKFIMVKLGGQESPQLVVVFNWLEELNKREAQ